MPVPPSILETFQLFFTSALVTLIVEQTNLYASQVLAESANSKWTAVTEDDIWAFLGFTILMGINVLPALSHYWRKDQVFHYAPVANRISRDRFMDILRFLHFVDNSSLPDRAVPDYDRLCRIRPVIEAVQEACARNFHGHQHQSIDEAMIAFKGRSSMKQYMPKKPTKRGFKVWVRSDSRSGYVCQMEFYTGKKGSTPEVGLGGSVVTRLTRDLVGQHYSVYMDNFFTSIPLFRNLLADNIYATGTMRRDRKGFPEDLVDVARRGLPSRGDSVSRQSEGLVVTVWQDTKPVTVLTTQHRPSATTTVVRKKIDGSKINVQCPQAIVNYNQHMGGFDIGDICRAPAGALQISLCSSC